MRVEPLRREGLKPLILSVLLTARLKPCPPELSRHKMFFHGPPPIELFTPEIVLHRRVSYRSGRPKGGSPTGSVILARAASCRYPSRDSRDGIFA